MDSTSALGSKLTGFGVGVETGSVLVWRLKLTCFFCRGQDRHCFFSCVCRKSLVFSVSMGIDLVFVMVVEIDLISVRGSNSNWFQCRDEIDLVVVWVIEIDLLLVCLRKITCFQDEHANWFAFCVGGLNWLDVIAGDRRWHHFSVGMKLIWLLCGWSKLTVFERGANITCFRCEHANRLGFCVGDPRLLGFSVGDRTWPDSSVRWNGFGCCVGCRKWLHLSAVDRNWFGVCVAVENGLSLASASKLAGFFGSGRRNRLSIGAAIKIDLISVIGSNIAWFSCAGSRLTCF